ncbi:MAG: Ldh family oxidoreductase [Actinomycetia bacterium]|nr:Ldh family oxidoreductase [Actinomycetes bacterium]
MADETHNESEAAPVATQALEDVVAAVLQGHGVTEDDARLVARTLVEADRRGIGSHGVMRLGIYVDRLKAGLVRARTEVTVERETPATAVLDGHHSMGQAVAARAMRLCLEKARTAHVAAVAVRNSSHFGAAAYWALMAPDEHMIGVAMSNTAPLMPPTGGRGARIGNNPLAVAVPARHERPLVLDMATSVVALGKVLLADKRGEPVPEGWGVTAAGEPTTDPKAILQGGFILPVGGPKGYGLSVMVDVLSGLLAGGVVGGEVRSMYRDFTAPSRIGHFFLAVDVGAFVPVEWFEDQVDAYIRYLRATPPAPGVERVMVPGEPEFLRAEAARTTVVLPRAVLEDVRRLAAEAGVDAGLVARLEAGPS